MTQSKTSQWPSIIEVIEEDQISQLPKKVWSLGPPVASSLQPFWFIHIVHAPHVLYSWYNSNITACPTLPVLRHKKWKIVEFLNIIEVHTPLSSSICFMDHWKIIDSLYIIGPTSNFKSQGSLAPSPTTEPRLRQGDDFLGVYSDAPTRAHTFDPGAPSGEGEERRHSGGGPLSSRSSSPRSTISL